MNWVGGSRSRLRVNNWKKRQKEFFEKKKHGGRMKMNDRVGVSTHGGPPKTSLDLFSLQMANLTAKQFQNKDVTHTSKNMAKVNIERPAHSNSKRHHNVEIPGSSPSPPSMLQLGDDTVSSSHDPVPNKFSSMFPRAHPPSHSKQDQQQHGATKPTSANEESLGAKGQQTRHERSAERKKSSEDLFFQFTSSSMKPTNEIPHTSRAAPTNKPAVSTPYLSQPEVISSTEMSMSSSDDQSDEEDSPVFQGYAHSRKHHSSLSNDQTPSHSDKPKSPDYEQAGYGLAAGKGSSLMNFSSTQPGVSHLSSYSSQQTAYQPPARSPASTVNHHRGMVDGSSHQITNLWETGGPKHHAVHMSKGHKRQRKRTGDGKVSQPPTPGDWTSSGPHRPSMDHHRKRDMHETQSFTPAGNPSCGGTPVRDGGTGQKQSIHPGIHEDPSHLGDTSSWGSNQQRSIPQSVHRSDSTPHSSCGRNTEHTEHADKTRSTPRWSAGRPGAKGIRSHAMPDETIDLTCHESTNFTSPESISGAKRGCSYGHASGCDDNYNVTNSHKRRKGLGGFDKRSSPVSSDASIHSQQGFPSQVLRELLQLDADLNLHGNVTSENPSEPSFKRLRKGPEAFMESFRACAKIIPSEHPPQTVPRTPEHKPNISSHEARVMDDDSIEVLCESPRYNTAAAISPYSNNIQKRALESISLLSPRKLQDTDHRTARMSPKTPMVIGTTVFTDDGSIEGEHPKANSEAGHRSHLTVTGPDDAELFVVGLDTKPDGALEVGEDDAGSSITYSLLPDDDISSESDSAENCDHISTSKEDRISNHQWQQNLKLTKLDVWSNKIETVLCSQDQELVEPNTSNPCVVDATEGILSCHKGVQCQIGSVKSSQMEQVKQKDTMSMEVGTQTEHTTICQVGVQCDNPRGLLSPTLHHDKGIENSHGGMMSNTRGNKQILGRTPVEELRSENEMGGNGLAEKSSGNDIATLSCKHKLMVSSTGSGTGSSSMVVDEGEGSVPRTDKLATPGFPSAGIKWNEKLNGKIDSTEVLETTIGGIQDVERVNGIEKISECRADATEKLVCINETECTSRVVQEVSACRPNVDGDLESEDTLCVNYPIVGNVVGDNMIKLATQDDSVTDRKSQVKGVPEMSDLCEKKTFVDKHGAEVIQIGVISKSQAKGVPEMTDLCENKTFAGKKEAEVIQIGVISKRQGENEPALEREARVRLDEESFGKEPLALDHKDSLAVSDVGDTEEMPTGAALEPANVTNKELACLSLITLSQDDRESQELCFSAGSLEFQTDASTNSDTFNSCSSGNLSDIDKIFT